MLHLIPPTVTFAILSSIACYHDLSLLTAHEDQRVRVIHLTDGDTFKAITDDRQQKEIVIRVMGIDCPESRPNAKCKRDGERGQDGCDVQVPLGKKASKRARELLDGSIVKLESPKGDGEFRPDVYHRTLAYVRLPSGDDYGEQMIREGFCQDYNWKYPHMRHKLYAKAPQPFHGPKRL